MKLSTSLLVGLCLSLLCSACTTCLDGSGARIDRTLTLPAVEGLVVESSPGTWYGCNVNIDAASKYAANASLNIEAQENILPLITPVVNDGTLELEYAECIKSMNSPQLELTVNTLSYLEVNTIGESVVFDTELATDRLHIKVGSMAQLKLNVNVKHLTIDAAESANLTLNGSIDTLYSNIDNSAKVVLSGSAYYHQSTCKDFASLDAGKLITQVTKIEATNLSKATVNVNQSLKAEASNTAKISYHGKPGSSVVSYDGLATVTPIEE